MAEKDVVEKILESYNDVFSDIVNVLLFQGKQVLSGDELEDQAPRSYYKSDGKVREIERDVADYFVQMRENGDYIPDSHEIKHVQETMQLLGDIGDRHD